MGEKIDLTLTSQLSDDKSVTASVKSFDTMDSKASLFRNDSTLQYSQEIIDPAHSKCSCLNKVAVLVFIQLLVTIVSVVAIILSVIVATNYYEVMKRHHDDIKMLEDKIMDLEHMINTSTENLTVEYVNLDSLQFQVVNIGDQIENVTETVNTLHQQLNSEYSHLENQVDKVAMQLSHNIRGNISQLNTTISNNMGRITSVNSMITTLDNRIQAINTNIELTANLYDDCIVDHEMCIGTELSNIYWRQCMTQYLPLNMTGYYTMDMKCDYESNYLGNMVSTVLQKNSMDGTVQCRCNVILPDHYRDNFFDLPHDFMFMCNLNITRCPISQQLL